MAGKLTKDQRRIVETLDRPLFVAAGAGSGKSSTLANRVAWALTPGSGKDGRPYLSSLDRRRDPREDPRAPARERPHGGGPRGRLRVDRDHPRHVLEDPARPRPRPRPRPGVRSGHGHRGRRDARGLGGVGRLPDRERGLVPRPLQPLRPARQKLPRRRLHGHRHGEGPARGCRQRHGGARLGDVSRRA